MKNKMIMITVVLLTGFVICVPLFLLIRNAITEALAITLGVSLYHFSMRLAVGTILNRIMKNKADPTNLWFRPKSYESNLYKAIAVRKWKKYLPTYDPQIFDASKKTVKEIVEAGCQAEIVHEVIMVFSLLPMVLIPFLGGAAALILTSLLSMLLDFSFVILQRYNRPKLIRVMQRFDKLKETKNCPPGN